MRGKLHPEKREQERRRRGQRDGQGGAGKASAATTRTRKAAGASQSKSAPRKPAARTQGALARKYPASGQPHTGRTQSASERTQTQEQRSDAIIGAAMEEFALNGYAGARLDDVARRAGVSKGLVYVYFETKEALFKAAVRRLLIPRFASLTADIEASDMATADMLRGPILGFMQDLPKSRLKVLLRLLISEGQKHADLTAFYHDEVIARGLGFLRGIFQRGVARGDIKPNAFEAFPQLLVAPMLVTVVWSMLFERHAPLDTDRLLAAHIENVIELISVEPPSAARLPRRRQVKP